MDTTLNTLLDDTNASLKRCYRIAAVNILWIIAQNVYVGIWWKQENSFAYPAILIMLLNGICPLLLILGCYFLVNHFLVLVQLFCILCLLLACVSLLCMVVVVPQMHAFHQQCIAGFPTEDCRIYDIRYMGPILLSQTILDLVVVAIKTDMFRKTHHLYLLLHEYKSPLLRVIGGERFLQLHLPAIKPAEKPPADTD